MAGQESAQIYSIPGGSPPDRNVAPEAAEGITRERFTWKSSQFLRIRTGAATKSECSFFWPARSVHANVLRDVPAVNNESLGKALESLERAGRISHTAGGWQRLR